jgi:cytoskeletal protein CcmA (bactofilin family)
MKKVIVLSLSLLMFGFTASAAEFISPAGTGNKYIDVPASETHKNLYIAGGIVNLAGTTLGDLIAAGGIVKVSGTVDSDLFVAGGRVDVDAQVGRNVHAAGGNLYFNKPVGGDLVAAGGIIEVTKESSVAGDLALAGGSMIIDSPVSGNVTVRGGDVVINGRVSGNVDVVATKSLTLGSSAVVNGKVTYKGPTEAQVNSDAKVGTIDFTKVSRGFGHRGGFWGILVIGSIVKLIMLLVAGAVLIWLLPKKTSAVVLEAMDNPLRQLGIGLLVLIVSPILGVLLLITVVGIYLGIVVFLAYGIMIIIGSILALFYAGRLVWGWYQKDAAVNLWRDLGVGAIVVLILKFIPFLGLLAILILTLITLGSLATHWHKETFQN